MKPPAEKLNIDRALDTKGFAEFLAKQPDGASFDIANESEVSERFQTFESINKVGKGLREVYSRHIGKEMGIKLDAKDLESIDVHIEKLALEEPAEFSKIRDQLDLFKDLQKQIPELEKQAAALGNVENLTKNLDSLNNERTDLETAEKHRGVFGKLKLSFWTIATYFREDSPAADAWNTVNAVRETYGKIDRKEAAVIRGRIGNQISEIEKTLSAIRQIEEMRALSQEMFGKIRKELLGGISEMPELTAAIQARVSAQLMEMMNNGSFKTLNQAQNKFDSLKTAAQTSETGIDPLGGLDEAAFQERVDAALEKTASEEIMQAVMRAKMGSNALTRLEKSLEPFLQKEKIGSKEGDEAREFISETLEEAAQNLGDSTEDKAKKLMIARILIKIRS